MPDRIALRPHHALCLHFFEGKGYSDAYVQNARAVLNTLQAQGEFTVTAGPDALCRACPHLNENGLCRWQEKVLRFDAAAKTALGLQENAVYDFNAFSKERCRQCVPTVCPDCEWTYICTRKET